MTKYREILRLKSLGFSDRNIALSIPGLVTPVSGPSETSIPGNRKP